MTGAFLHRVPLAVPDDVFAARQVARRIAVALGLDEQRQVRLATALSELTRDALALGGGSVVFARAETALVVTVTMPGGGVEPPGVAAARRLVRGMTWDGDASPRRAVLVKPLPATATWDADRAAELATDLAGLVPQGAHEELRQQNADLVGALERLQHQQDELVRLNEELQETNRGVMALYHQLSAELEETNRGVVALYAELDERGRQLAAASEAKTRFLRSVSHELRTPVNSVLGLARLLLDPAADPLSEEQRHQVTLIHGSAEDLLALVNSLLDLARAESGRVAVHPRPVDAAELVTRLAELARALVAPGVTVATDLPPGPVPLVTDPDLLTSIVSNLVGNAAKFTERGTVTVGASAADADGQVRITVADTGPGIPTEHLERVFEEFHQVPGPGQRRGTGLGLPLARRLATVLGGTLEVTSEVGRGSIFMVTIPAEIAPFDGSVVAPGHGREGRAQA